MKAFIVLCTVLLASSAFADEDYCYQDASRACNAPTSKSSSSQVIPNCNAVYGGVSGVFSDLQAYANEHIVRSFEYLAMSTHYSNYEKNRAGFAKLFRGLSDDTWNKAFDLIKYITMRGGEMKFGNMKDDKINNKNLPYEVSELQSMAKALDMEKDLAKEAMEIHRSVSRKLTEYHDPAVANYLEEEFMEKHSDVIRKLAGYTSDLNKLVFSQDASLALYMFDEMLQK